MDVNQIVLYTTATIALYTLYEIIYKQARWRTKAEVKLEAIDVTWQPLVDARLDSHDDRHKNIDANLLGQNKEILKELREMNASITAMDKNLAVAVEARHSLAERVVKLEQPQTR